MDKELLERIANALERIADYLEGRTIVVPLDDLEGEWDATTEY